jgi:hypothetical protein
MFLAPMREQGFIGSFAPLSQASQFSPGPLEIACERSLESSLSSCVETDRDRVHTDQFVAGLAVHKGMLTPRHELCKPTDRKI